MFEEEGLAFINLVHILIYFITGFFSAIFQVAAS
jgi:hypothetical protein